MKKCDDPTCFYNLLSGTLCDSCHAKRVDELNARMEFVPTAQDEPLPDKTGSYGGGIIRERVGGSGRRVIRSTNPLS